MHTNNRLAVAIHILTLLALRQDESLTSETIARSVTTNAVVIRRTLGDLRRAGLVASQPGNGGGWRLARPAERITLLDAYHALHEGLLFGMHPQPSKTCCIGVNIQQALTDVFQTAQTALEHELAHITLAGMLAHLEAIQRQKVLS